MPATHWRDHGRKSRPGETQGPINWDVSVAADLLQKSSLNINFSSTLRVSDNYCDDLENSANWVKVSSQSKADFIYDPQALNQRRTGWLFQMFSQLGMLLGNQARYLQMVPASQAGEDVLVGHDLILIGEPANNPLVAEALKSAPVKIDGNTRAIQSTLLHLTVEDGQPVGLVQEFTSPWDKTRNVLVITGTSDAGVGWAAGILGNPTTRSSLKGDIAIVDRSGALTMLNSKAPETSRSLVATSLKNDQGPSEAVLWISAAAVLLVLVIGLVILLARRRTRAH